MSDTDTNKPVCGEPVAFPFLNVTIPGARSSKRGIPMSFGTPPQLIAVDPEVYSNSTVIQQAPINKNNCEYSTAFCIWKKGGIFDAKKSSTHSGGLGKEQYGGDKHDTYTRIKEYAQDTLKLSDGRELQNFPIGIEDGPSSFTENRPVVGLGRNSTIVNELYQNKTIPSRVWSLDYGWTGADSSTWRDGELVFGGYNKKRVKGDFFKFPFGPIHNLPPQSPCSYVAFVTQMRVHKVDGDVESIFKSEGDSMRVCLEPSYSLITLPSRIFSLFNSQVGSVYNDLARSEGDFYLWGYAVQNSKQFKGELEIEFSNGFKTKIANHQLVQPYRDMNKQTGQSFVKNASTMSVLKLNSLQSETSSHLPLFGVPFFSSVYMSADLDNENFYLAEPSHPGDSDGSPDDYAVLPDSKVATCENPAPPPDKAQDSDTPNAGAANSSTNVGAIAGGVVAAIIVLLLIIAAIFLFRRRKNRKSMASYEPAASSEGQGQGQGISKTDYKGHYAPASAATYGHSMFSPELESTPIHQLDSSTVHEAPGFLAHLPGPNEYAELDAQPSPPGTNSQGFKAINNSPPSERPPIPPIPSPPPSISRKPLWGPGDVSATSTSPYSKKSPVSGI